MWYKVQNYVSICQIFLFSSFVHINVNTAFYVMNSISRSICYIYGMLRKYLNIKDKQHCTVLSARINKSECMRQNMPYYETCFLICYCVFQNIISFLSSLSLFVVIALGKQSIVLIRISKKWF